MGAKSDLQSNMFIPFGKDRMGCPMGLSWFLSENHIPFLCLNHILFCLKSYKEEKHHGINYIYPLAGLIYVDRYE